MRRVCHPQNFFTKVSEKVSPTLVARDMVEGSRLDHQIQSLGLRSLGGGEQHRANGTPGDTMSPSTNNSLFSVGDGEGLLFFRPGSSNSTTTKADAHREQLDDEGRQLLILYKWLDTLPLPSIKRSSGIVARDFSDGTAVADIIRYYFPTYVEQHNYVKTSNSSRKKANWEVLITKVLLKRAPFKRAFGGLASSRVRAADIEALCAGVTGRDGRNTALEGFLWKLMRCCLGEVGGEVGGLVTTTTMTMKMTARQALRDLGNVNVGDRDAKVADRGGMVHRGETCTSDEDEDGGQTTTTTASTSTTTMIQALVDENTKLSNMVIKQDGLLRLMQAKISTMERELGLL